MSPLEELMHALAEAERLRWDIDRHQTICAEQQAEIERLRTALEAIAKGAPYGYKAAAYEEIARAALANQQQTKPD
jgi:hypothetical protein